MYLSSGKRSQRIILIFLIPTILLIFAITGITIPTNPSVYDYIFLVLAIMSTIIFCIFGGLGLKKNSAIMRGIRKTIIARASGVAQNSQTSLPETHFSQEATYHPSQKPSDEDGWK
jgi:hypothetical protein